MVAGSILLMLFGAGCTAVRPSEAGVSASDAYRAAQSNAAKDNCAAAQPLYDVALQRDPRFVDALVGKARCAQQSGDYEIAADAYTRAISVDDSDYKLYIGRGTAEGSEGNAGAAIRDFKAALRVAPEETAAYVDIAQGFAGQGDYSEAISTIATAIRLDPKRSDLFRMREGYNQAAQNFGRAEADYEAALATARDASSRAAAYAAGASMFQEAGNYDLAAFAIAHALTLDKSNPAYYQGAGSIYLAQSRYNDSIRAYTQAIKYTHDPRGIAQLRVLLGDAYEKAGDLAAARGQYTLSKNATNDPSFKQTVQAKIDAINKLSE